MAKRNYIARDLWTNPLYRKRIVKKAVGKGSYRRKVKHVLVERGKNHE